MIQRPDPERICLILYHPPDNSDPLCLDIPTSEPATFCLRPRKYLRYLDAKVSPGEVVDDIGDEGALEDQGVYQYCYSSAEGHPLRHAVDLYAITRSPTPDITDASSSLISLCEEQFREILERRDGGCIFSRGSPAICVAAHIIPCVLGDKWFQSLIRSRNAYDEDVTDLHSVDDVRNGFLTTITMQYYFEKQFLAILKVTPNPVLGIDDVPHKERPLYDDLEHPSGERLTPQFLKAGKNRVFMEEERWFGADAAFKIGTIFLSPQHFYFIIPMAPLF
ncbi:hypothetical protein BGW80DRAFT_1459043 [Lactifluus volemus]|nr:hypothetical protein BGW80DRAFT_1459043 [Lactifluus volemus]